jgi:Tfp pilus assembly protein PilF
MADIGLNQNISIRNRKFHFQTATNIEDGIIRTEVFEQGRLMYAQDNRYERRGSGNPEGGESRLRQSLDQFHRSIITSLKAYFDISDFLQTADNAVSHYRLGAIFLSLHIFDKCQQHLLKCISLDPKFYSAHIALARCYFYQKNYKDSEEILQTLVKTEIPYPDLYNLLGMVMLEQKNYIQCLNHFRNAVKLNQKYKEAYFNIAAAIFKRISYLRTQDKGEDVQKNLDFLNVILNKIDKVGNDDDRAIVAELRKAFAAKNFGKIQTLIYDYRHRLFYQRMLPEIIGYEFYLWLRYLPDRLDIEKLLYFEDKFTKTLADNDDYADMWNYLALIHLLLCREHFLKGLQNFKEATRINPQYTKAKNNLRLVENDGREFLSLIKAITK